MRIAILGCGPAGLMAAHAVSLQGHEPVIFSRKEPSKMFGAMYLHSPIYGVNAPKPDFILSVMKVGSAKEYAEKVYGDPQHPVSFDKYHVGDVPGWDLTETYERLWEMCEDQIRDVELRPGNITDICHEFALVLSTVPAYVLCHMNSVHEFHKKDIWVLHGIDGEAVLPEPSWLLYYMGDPTVDWYRYTQLNKYQAWEYSKEPDGDLLRIPPFDLTTGVKPLGNNCDCYRSNVRRLGRFGKWEKNVLTHHAFAEALAIVKEEARALQSL
jgi:hypothetical protein